LGIAYRKLGQYKEAIEYQQQALAIFQDIGNRAGEGSALNDLGIAYRYLGQYKEAIEYHQQALAIARDLGDRVGEGNALGNLGIAYYFLGQYQKAIEFHRQSLAIKREIGNRSGQATSLGNLGNAYLSLDQYQKAIEFLQQQLAIAREIGNRRGEADSLGNLGLANHFLGQYQKAIEFYQQALAIDREIGDRAGEGITLSNLGILLAKQNQPELAIVFLKQSVNVTEAIRQDIQGLPQEQQQSYTETIASSYRRLADLLLQQDRVLEAQEVIDLLKLQELEDYLRDVRGNVQTAQGLDFWEAEQKILQLYHQWTEQTPLPPLETFLNSPEVTALVGQLQRTARGQNLNPEQLARLQDNLQALDNAALLYPLILDDRIELVLVTPSSLVQKTVEVERVQLNRAIANFLSQINNPSSDPLPNAKKLYQWLIQPLAAELETAQVNTILYAADGQLRYIPLAALHDGNQYLIQRFTLNHITAASLTNFNRNGTRPMQILAAAYSNPQLNYQFQIGGKPFNFNGLKFAGIEVETIAQEIPDTTAFFNKDFSRANVEPRLGENSIVHLATHAEFVSGLPHESVKNSSRNVS
jgi:CHAT domain-containing protein